MPKNKVKYGLKNAHYAVLTEGENSDTYGTVKPWPGMVKLSLNKVGTVTPFIADDMEYHRAGKNGGYDGTLECAEWPEELDVDVFGEVVDGDGVSFERSEMPQKAIALLFEFEGDVHAIKRCLHKCFLTKPNIESEATTQPTVKTNVFNIQSRPNRAGYVQAKTTSTTTSEKVANWYSAVPTYVTPIGG